jgi:hypothetical protein
MNALLGVATNQYISWHRQLAQDVPVEQPAHRYSMETFNNHREGLGSQTPNGGRIRGDWEDPYYSELTKMTTEIVNTIPTQVNTMFKC